MDVFEGVEKKAGDMNFDSDGASLPSLPCSLLSLSLSLSLKPNQIRSEIQIKSDLKFKPKQIAIYMVRSLNQPENHLS